MIEGQVATAQRSVLPAVACSMGPSFVHRAFILGSKYGGCVVVHSLRRSFCRLPPRGQARWCSIVTYGISCI